MNQSIQCRDPEILKRFVLGLCSDVEAAPLESHLLSCGECQEAVRRTSTHDDQIVAALRDGGPAISADDSHIRKLLAEISVHVVQATLNARAKDSTQSQDSSSSTSQNLSMLRPAEADDEIGRLGSFRVLKRLGQGGMGIVFLAEDLHLKRQVALKVLSPSQTQVPEAIERFLREARAAAAVKHDHIVTIYQVGEDGVVPYIAMELLEGESLDDRLRRKAPLPTVDALSIACDTAAGLAAAHARGLLHRDIKPANIWLEASSGRVKILDFGLARNLTGDVQLTQSGALAGTPAYMSPEQIDSQPLDGRTDLFSLGCVLYRMLTGKLPFVGETLVKTLLAVSQSTPAAIDSLNRSVSQDVMRLVDHLLAKNPIDRPPTADEVVVELRRLVSSERSQVSDVVSAVPASPTDRNDHGRKHRLRFAAAAAGAFVFAALGIWIIIRDRDNNVVGKVEVPAGGTFEAAQSVSMATSNTSTTIQSQPKPENGTISVSALDALKRENISPEELKSAGFGDPTKAPAELVAVLGDSRWRHWGTVTEFAYTRDGQTIASLGSDNVKIWDVKTGRERLMFRPSDASAGISAVAISPDGRTIAWCESTPRQIVLVDLATGARSGALAVDRFVEMLAFDRESRFLAAARDDGTVQLWDVAKRSVVWTTAADTGRWGAMAWSPDSKSIVTGGEDKVIKFHDVDDGREVDVLTGHEAAITSLAFSSDGKTLASSQKANIGNKGVVVWSLDDRQPRMVLKAAGPVALSPDGSTLAATVGPNNEVVMWDTATAQEKCRQDKRNETIGVPIAMAFSPDGTTLAFAQSSAIRFLNAATAEELAPPKRRSPLSAVTVSPTGRWIASSAYHDYQIWDVANGVESAFQRLPLAVRTMRFHSDDGLTAVSADTSGKISVWNSADPGRSVTLTTIRNPYGGLALSPNGSVLAYPHTNGEVDLWDVAQRQKLKTLPSDSGKRSSHSPVFWSPDGTLFAVADRETREIEVWDVAKAESLAKWKTAGTFSLAFSPNGRTLAVGEPNGRVKIWDVASWTEKSEILVSTPSWMRFNPDGKSLATISMIDRVVRLWDANTGEQKKSLVLNSPRGEIGDAAFDPTGRYLLTANGNGTVYVLRLHAEPKIMPPAPAASSTDTVAP